MAKERLEPENCQECGKQIRGSARANVIDSRIVCTPCWKKLDVERQWNGPATEQQVMYARHLALHFPQDITKREMSDLINRKVEYDDEPTAPGWLLARAVGFGVDVSRYLGTKQLYDRMFDRLRASDVLLATWFVENVAREVNGGSGSITLGAMEAIARELAGIPQVMKSIKRYKGSGLADFGVSMDPEGWMRQGGSQATIAYKIARERLSAVSER